MSPNHVGSGTLLARGPGGYTPLPLLGMEVDVDIQGVLVRCALSQNFHNPGPTAVEAIYVFPLPERAAVDELELQIGDRRIVGEIHSRAEAKRIYVEAKRLGKKAGLLEQERPNLFTVTVANINPGETVQVHLRYLEEVQLEGEDFSFVFPMTFTPRYLPPRPRSESRVPASPAASRESFLERFYDPVDPARILPPFRPSQDWDAPKARVSVRLRPGWPTQEVNSISHEITFAEEGPKEWLLELIDGAVNADRDFHLRWSPLQTDQTQTAFLTETRDGGDYGLLMILPPRSGTVSAADVPTETLFILDVSGSMDGPSIAQARRALQAALERLSPRDRFNVLAFNESTRLFRSEFQSANPSELQLATQWVGRLEAGGGTEILGALRRGFDLCAADRNEFAHRRIVFVTDGAVGNELAVLAEVERRLGNLRIHTLGIGSAPNRYLMSRMAEFGRGHCEYLSTDPDLESRMDSFLERIARPAVTSLEVEWHGVEAIKPAPEILPDLYSGQPLYLSARLRPLDSGQGDRAERDEDPQVSVTVSGRVGSRRFSEEVLATQVSSQRSGIGTRWARGRVAHWMDAAILGVDETEISEHVTALGKAFHLVTRYTSFVAVETFPTIQSPAARARVPNALPNGSQLGGVLPQGGTDRLPRTLLGLALGLLGLGLWMRGNFRG